MKQIIIKWQSIIFFNLRWIFKEMIHFLILFFLIVWLAERPVTSTFCSSWATWPSPTLRSSRSGVREAACTGTCTSPKPSLTLCAASTWPGRRRRAWSKTHRFASCATSLIRWACFHDGFQHDWELCENLTRQIQPTCSAFDSHAGLFLLRSHRLWSPRHSIVFFNTGWCVNYWHVPPS